MHLISQCKILSINAPEVLVYSFEWNDFIWVKVWNQITWQYSNTNKLRQNHYKIHVAAIYALFKRYLRLFFGINGINWNESKYHWFSLRKKGVVVVVVVVKHVKLRWKLFPCSLNPEIHFEFIPTLDRYVFFLNTRPFYLAWNPFLFFP